MAEYDTVQKNHFDNIMKKLAAQLKAQLDERQLSQIEMSRRSGVDKAVVWKLCAGRAVPKGETFRKLLTKGMGIAEGTKLYNDLFSLWTNEKNGASSAREMVSLSLPASSKDPGSLALRTALATIPAHELPTVIAAITDTKIREALPMLLKLRER